MRMAVVVPATNQPETLARCLDAVELSTVPPDEVVVVQEPREYRAAEARNDGVSRTSADVIVFVDADVCVHPDALERIRKAFESDPGLAAIFGSYDDAPDARDVVSTFRNLLHHHVHQSSRGSAATFWAGIGGVRRDAFLQAGGFDASIPGSIEDIELGMRLARRGSQIVLDPAVLGTHLKRWTLRTMLWTDFALRGVPWVMVLLRDRRSSDVLNLGWRHRISALASLIAAIGLARRRVRLVWPAVVALLLLNRKFYLLLLRKQGPARAALGLPLHMSHHLTGIAALPIGVLAYLRDQDRKRHTRE